MIASVETQQRVTGRRLRWMMAGVALTAAVTLGTNQAIAGSRGHGEDDYPNGRPSAETVARWTAEYDQGEIAKLLQQAEDNNYGEVTELDLVSVLEYRHACRTLDRLVQTSAPQRVAAASAERDTVVERLRERTTPASQSADVFGKLIDQLVSGDVDGVTSYVAVNCDFIRTGE